MRPDPDTEFAQALTALECAAALMAGEGSPAMLAALRQCATAINPRIAEPSAAFLKLFNGCDFGVPAVERPSDVACDEPAPISLAEALRADGVADFDAARTRRMITREFRSPAPSQGYDPKGAA